MLERDRESGEKLKKRHTTSIPPRRLHHSHCMIRMRARRHKLEVVIAVRLHRRDVHAVQRVLAVLWVEGWEVPVWAGGAVGDGDVGGGDIGGGGKG